MEALDGLRFLFVTGKGGTGKSTLAAALGLALSRRGRKTLVVASQTTTQLGRLFETDVTTRPTRVADQLFVASIDAEAAMREYVEAFLSSRLLTDALFHKKFSRGFLYGIPGLRSWALLGKAWYFTQKERSGPKLPEAPFDVVVLDAPATGDSADLLRVPRVLLDLMPLGPFRKDAEDCQALLENPDETRVFAVSLPEEMPVTETTELVRVLGNELGLPLGALLVNRVREPLFRPEARAALGADGVEFTEPLVRSTLAAARRRALREAVEAREMARLAAVGFPLVSIPEFGEAPVGLAGLHPIAEHFEAERDVVFGTYGATPG